MSQDAGVGTPATVPTNELDSLYQANERYRRIGQWLIVIFAAIASALLAGTQLSAWGELEGDRLDKAIVGVVAGLAGAMIAIVGASLLLPLRAMTLTQVAALPAGSPERKWLAAVDPFPGGEGMPTSIPDLIQQTDQQWQEVQELDQALTTTVMAADDPDDDAVNDAKTLLADARKRLRLLNLIGARVTAHAQYAQVRHTFHSRVRWMIFGGAVLGAFGIALFSWAANPPDPNPPVAAAFAGADLSDLSLRGVDFGSADLKGVDLSNSDLTGADLSRAKLGGVTWVGVTCPDGVEVAGELTSCEGRLKPK